MKGTHKVSVRAKRVRFDFELHRNLTILQGDSATGKTTLIDMIQQYLDNSSGSSITVNCDKKCFVLSGALWKGQLEQVQDGIVFIDEGNEFIFSDEFAEAIRGTDNYYVIVAREGLPALPYSVEEIYGIRTSGRYGKLKQTYNEFYHIYGRTSPAEAVHPV